jgi:hypothetical protein
MIPSDPQEDQEVPDPVPGPEADPVEAEDEDLAEDADGLEPAPVPGIDYDDGGDPDVDPETGNPEPTDPANPATPPA